MGAAAVVEGFAAIAGRGAVHIADVAGLRGRTTAALFVTLSVIRVDTVQRRLSQPPSYLTHGIADPPSLLPQAPPPLNPTCVGVPPSPAVGQWADQFQLQSARSSPRDRSQRRQQRQQRRAACGSDQRHRLRIQNRPCRPPPHGTASRCCLLPRHPQSRYRTRASAGCVCYTGAWPRRASRAKCGR